MTPQEYCQEKAASSGSSFYYSFLFLAEQKRQAITALYAFCREVDDVVDEISDAGVANIKLQWWRDEVSRLYDHKPEHPVTKALLPHLQTFNLQQQYFNDIIDGMQMDLDFNAYKTFKDLQNYCYRAASVVGLLSAEIFGYTDKQTLRYAHDLGMAFQLTNILRDVREDAQRGRIYIPEEDMQACNVSLKEIRGTQTTDNIKKLFKLLADRAHQYYQSAESLLPDADRYSQRSGLIMSEVYQSLLEEIELDGFRILEHKIKLTPFRKLWLSWRAARREKKRYKKYLKSHAK